MTCHKNAARLQQSFYFRNSFGLIEVKPTLIGADHVKFFFTKWLPLCGCYFKSNLKATFLSKFLSHCDLNF